jgi:hypothetical protein
MIGRSSFASEGERDTTEQEQQEVACLEDDTVGEGFEFDCTKVTRKLFEALDSWM